MYTSFTDWESGLAHHGIRGMHWGQRRYQNPDGSLTPAGVEHYKVVNRIGYGPHARGNKERNINKANKYNARAKKYGRLMNEQSDRLLEASRSGKRPQPGNNKYEHREYKYGRKMAYNIYKRNKALGHVSKEEDQYIKRMAREDKRVERLDNWYSKKEKIESGMKKIKNILETAYTAKKLIKG